MGIRSFFARRFSDCRKNHMVRRLTRKLDLDSTQQSRLREVQETVAALRQDAMEGMRYQRDALTALFSREPFDRAEALRLAQVPMAMINDVLPQAVDRFAHFYDALSVEQKDRLREMFSHRRCGARYCGA